MADFSKIKFSDAMVQDVRIFDSSVEVDYIDWQEQKHTLRFNDFVSCLVLSAYGKVLSHVQIEDDGEYLRECCEGAEEDVLYKCRVFNFIDAWNDQKILRIVARNVVEKS